MNGITIDVQKCSATESGRFFSLLRASVLGRKRNIVFSGLGWDWVRQRVVGPNGRNTGIVPRVRYHVELGPPRRTERECALGLPELSGPERIARSPFDDALARTPRPYTGPLPGTIGRCTFGGRADPGPLCRRSRPMHEGTFPRPAARPAVPRPAVLVRWLPRPPRPCNALMPRPPRPLAMHRQGESPWLLALPNGKRGLS